MAEISAKLVKELRDKTGAGMADCKKALEQSGGDIEKAIEHLRKQGAAIAAKRADREAKEGAIVIAKTPDDKLAVMVEVNCETDFVARNESFLKFANAVANAALERKISTLEALSQIQLGADFDHLPVSQAIETMTGKLGEKIVVSRISLLEASEGVISSYIHPGSRLGTMVHLTGVNGNNGNIGKEIAMQVAASAPLALTRADLPKETIEKEAEILREQAKNEGKPPQVIERIVNGRLEKFYQEVVLLDQPYFKDSDKSIAELLKEAGSVEVKRFVRFQLGER
ncbi:MAG: translation elongation factor Ts [Chloroherpetonaceae bacterium]|nr:translation elongation factor Ts [Chloroherpetonaceae bacterium]MDW8437567.1 translation elongation factor Ts [Chloroherpetonaceae bacterium]